MVFAGSSPASPMPGTLQFTTQILHGRWFSVFASFLIMAGAGATYIFGIYSEDIKTSLNYNQQTLNTLSFFKDLGANVGILAGLINEVTPPSVVLLIGAFMNLAGYLPIYLAITGRISRPAVWQMCLYIALGANSQSFANTGSLVTCVKNFPESRGIVLGLLKGFVGLSGAIFTQLYHAFYDDDSKSLVLLIAWLPAAVSVIFVYTIRIIPVVRDEREIKVFYRFLYVSMGLAGYLMVMIILENCFNFNHQEFGASGAVVLLLLFLPLAVVVREEFLIWRRKSLELEGPVAVAVERPEKVASPPPPPPTAMATVEDENVTEKKWSFARIVGMLRSPERGEDYTIIQALVSIDMLVLFLATICGVGGTLTAIDNMGQIGKSLGYPTKSISTFVSLISIWNYCGRVTAGFASEIFLAKYNFPRPLALTIVLLLSCIGHLLIAFGVHGSLYVASIVIGFCFGAQWPLLFAIISEIFGLKYYSTLYNFGAVASPIGSYLLNVKVAGYLYDVEAEKLKQRGIVIKDALGKKNLTCIGVQCFKMSFLIITAATVFGALISLILVWRTRKFYKGDIYARFRPDSTEVELNSSSNKDDVRRENEEQDKMKT